MTQKPNNKFTPFEHIDLDLKNELINYARELKQKDGFESGLAATFIYLSFAEYVSKHLLASISHLTQQGSYNQFAGIIFNKHNNDLFSKRTLGQTTQELSNFEFPDQKGVIALLNNIAKLRNNLFHSFAFSGIDEIQKIIENDLHEIQENTEELFLKINIIYAGLFKIINPDLVQKNNDN